MPFKSYRDESKKNWGRDTQDGLTPDELQTGCLQRIADATEAMSKNYVTLHNDVAWYRKRDVEQNATITALHRQISSLKGVITKLKKKQLNGLINEK